MRPSAGARAAAVSAHLARAACSWPSTRTVRRLRTNSPAVPRPDPTLTPILTLTATHPRLSRPAFAQTARRRAARPRSAPRSRRRRPVFAAEARIARGHRVRGLKVRRHRVQLRPCRTSGRRLRRRSRCRLMPLLCRPRSPYRRTSGSGRPRRSTCRATLPAPALSSAAAPAALASACARLVGSDLYRARTPLCHI